MRRAWLLMLFALLPLACNRPASVVVTGPKSANGWEVRYNAAIALVRRGSDQAMDERVRETLLEMLDEEQQLRNFRHTNRDGREVSDSGTAHLTVITTLKALNELHGRRPDFDLAPFKPAIEKLTQSRNLAIKTEAKKTQEALAK